MKVLGFLITVLVSVSVQAEKYVCTVDEHSPSFTVEIDSQRTYARVYKQELDGSELLLLPQAGVNPGRLWTVISGQEKDEEVDWSKEKSCWKFGKNAYQFFIDYKIEKDGNVSFQRGRYTKTPTILVNPKVACEHPSIAPPVPVEIFCIQQ